MNVYALDGVTDFVSAGTRGRRAVLVVDGAVVATGYVDRVRAALAHLDSTVVHVVAPGEPSAASVDDVAGVIRGTRAPIVLAIGGGTALDTGKLAACVAGAAPGVEHYVLGANPLPPRAPLVAVPTTSGTGSEVTRTCVLTDAAGRKVWAWGDVLLPDLIVLDVSATVTMPPHVTSATGLDAFVHAVEASTGRRSTEEVVANAADAMQLVLSHLPTAVVDGSQLDARRSMQRAAFLAGMAIDAGGTGIAHAIGHALGSHAHVPHGASVAVGLAAAMPWNVHGAPGAFGVVAEAVGTSINELPDRFIELLLAARFPDVVSAFGPLAMTADQLAAAMHAPENRPMHDNNCRHADEHDRLELAAATLRLWGDLGGGGGGGGGGVGGAAR